jgi:uncharacterized protein YbjT (DUF2867 family)
MNITITGSLGHISKPLAEDLLRAGHMLTIISSSGERRAAIEALGANAAVGRVDDADFLAEAFAGADAVYLMIPPDVAVSDSRAYYNRVGNAYAAAVLKSDVRRIVHLSSWGADLAEGTGFILGSHDVEGILNALPEAVSVTHLRAGYIYYNLNRFFGMIRNAGFIGTNYGGDDQILMVAPSDIAAAATQELQRAADGRNVLYVVSDDRTPDDAAKVLGAAIGKPELKWTLLSDEQAGAGMLQHGMPASVAAMAVELNAAVHSGIMRNGYEQADAVFRGTVKLEDFAESFAAAYGRD